MPSQCYASFRSPKSRSPYNSLSLVTISHTALCPSHASTWHSRLQYHSFLHRLHRFSAGAPHLAQMGSSKKLSTSEELYHSASRCTSSLCDSSVSASTTSL